MGLLDTFRRIVGADRGLDPATRDRLWKVGEPVLFWDGKRMVECASQDEAERISARGLDDQAIERLRRTAEAEGYVVGPKFGARLWSHPYLREEPVPLPVEEEARQRKLFRGEYDGQRAAMGDMSKVFYPGAAAAGRTVNLEEPEARPPLKPGELFWWPTGGVSIGLGEGHSLYLGRLPRLPEAMAAAKDADGPEGEFWIVHDHAKPHLASGRIAKLATGNSDDTPDFWAGVSIFSMIARAIRAPRGGDAD